MYLAAALGAPIVILHALSFTALAAVLGLLWRAVRGRPAGLRGVTRAAGALLATIAIAWTSATFWIVPLQYAPY